MPLSLDQITSVMYPTILRAVRDQQRQWRENVSYARGAQWAESAFLRALEAQGTIERVASSAPIQANFLYDTAHLENIFMGYDGSAPIECSDDGSEEMSD